MSTLKGHYVAPDRYYLSLLPGDRLGSKVPWESYFRRASHSGDSLSQRAGKNREARTCQISRHQLALGKLNLHKQQSALFCSHSLWRHGRSQVQGFFFSLPCSDLCFTITLHVAFILWSKAQLLPWHFPRSSSKPPEFCLWTSETETSMNSLM